VAEDPQWFKKIKQYLLDAIQEHPDDLVAARGIRALIKWWLEVVRNLLAVSAFYFLAQKSDSHLLKTMANVTCFAYLVYFISWQNTFSIRFFPYIKHPRVNVWLNIVLWILIFAPIYFGVIYALFQVYLALVALPIK
jgi:hypothetical protein